MLKSIAVGSINLYQKYISPYKGYRCAYGVYHQNGTCSGIIKSRIQEHGLIKAYPMIKGQFQACKVAYLALQENKNVLGDGGEENSCVCDSCCFGNKEEKEKKKNSNGLDSVCSGCTPDIGDCGDCGSILPCDVAPCSL